MNINIFLIALLAVVQGLAELLPISSSAHVIIIEKLLHLDPTRPEMTFLLVMLHTGTMLAVLVYFIPRWRKMISVKSLRSFLPPWNIKLTEDDQNRQNFIKMIIIATVVTGLTGFVLIKLIEKILKGSDVEMLFGSNLLIATALAAAGVMVILSGRTARGADITAGDSYRAGKTPVIDSSIIGLVQGLAIPFRGFSRSGTTISAGLFRGLTRRYAEDLSFALSILITPAAILREYIRLRHFRAGHISIAFGYGVIGLILSFFAGLIAINWLTSWLEKGRWAWFGYYCVTLALVITGLTLTGVLPVN